MGIKSIAIHAARRTSDLVAKASSLSPAQLEEVDKRRQEYLTAMPDPADDTAKELTSRLIASVGVEIHGAYLNRIADLYSPLVADYGLEQSFDAGHNIRYFEITKWVVDSGENSLEKLVNVYDVLTDAHCNVALLFNRTKASCHAYLAVVDTDNSANNSDVNNYAKRLASAVKGNFPGSKLSKHVGLGSPPCMSGRHNFSVASVTNIPAEKSEKFASQTIEKLLDGIVPEGARQEYTIVLLATPVTDVEERKVRLSELYSALYPYTGWQTNYTFDDMSSVSSSATAGINVGVSAGIQNGSNQSFAQNEGIADSAGGSEAYTRTTSRNRTTGTSHTTTKSSSRSSTRQVNAGVTVGPVNAGASAGKSVTEGVSASRSLTESNMIGNSIGKTLTENFGRTISKGITTASGVMSSVNLGANFGVNFARSSNVTATLGKHEGITQSFTNHTIEHALEHLKGQMARLDQASALGMWDFSAYVLSDDPNIACNVAHTYHSLTQGEQSFLSLSAINFWRGDLGEKSESARVIFDYLKDLRHPIFALSPEVLDHDLRFATYPTVVTATTALSGKELAYALNFPKRSVPGLPVIECAEFGRGVSRFDEVEVGRTVRLGNVYHMHKEERSVHVDLSLDSLCAHTFVTGSTGAGKTNTVCHLLDEAIERDIGFLVIEPAKGEYKDYFGSEESVSVFGTNPFFSALLKINPFSFPAGVHVLEHLDRLVEVFNACWPMYAAMPAVLKDAVERSYADAGWNLVTSHNPYGNDLYPTFVDVARNVTMILNESEYDAENKGAYKGALITRLRALTMGIIGQVFSSDEIEATTLFDTRVICDLSRVGSMETKALIMGVLILKLQEHRMASRIGMNAALRHLTVIEEAHNLLRRTSLDQVSESANLVGKSVEMLSNAIAEMRAYGEGFIICDQAPGLLDLSVIRNTNTKIIMRIPDLSDRELVGRAASLNDAQIIELARLPRGVAAVFQNDWIEPVLCLVEKAVDSTPYEYQAPQMNQSSWSEEDAVQIANLLVEGAKLSDESEIGALHHTLRRLDLTTRVKVAILRYVTNPPERPDMVRLAPIMGELFPTVYSAVADAYKRSKSPLRWSYAAESALQSALTNSVINLTVGRSIVQGVIRQYVQVECANEDAYRMWQIQREEILASSRVGNVVKHS